MSIENTNSLRHTILQPKTGIVHLGLGVFFGRMLRFTYRRL